MVELLENLLTLEKSKDEFLKQKGNEWLKNQHDKAVDFIVAEDYLRASTRCYRITDYYGMKSIEFLEEFNADLVRWKFFRLSMEYLRLAITLDFSIQSEITNPHSLARITGLLLYGLITERKDICSLTYPILLRFLKSNYDEKYPGFDHLYIHRLISYLKGDLGKVNFGKYDIAVSNDNISDEQLVEIVGQHCELASGKNGEGVFYLAPVNVIPLDVLYCFDVRDVKPHSVLNEFLLILKSSEYESDESLEEIELKVSEI